MRGNRVFSGVGGMVDFMRGTYRSARGKFVIAIHATDPGEEESHIVPVLPQGSGILASRAAAQWVVTEFGGVNLQAKSLHERAVALIEIAHPKFREELYNRARIEGLLSKGDPISLFKPVVYPQELEKRGNVEGEAFLFRPAKAQDLRAIQEFFYGLQDQDVHYRFLRTMKAFPRQEMAKMANIDYHNRMTLLVLQGEMGFERVVAIGRYRALEDSDRVEVDVVVAEEYRQKGVARRLMNYLFEIAKGKGFGGVRAYVAHDNPKTMKFIKTMGYKAKAVLNMGVWEVDIPFDQPTEEPYLEIVYPGQNDQG
jgi:GNAT superfamily N-acetyltransferase